MRLGIVGGKLQGLEIVYLSKKAGFESVLIDKASDCPARNLADEFYCMDIIEDSESVQDVLRTCDMIIPAIENNNILKRLCVISENIDKKLLYDPEAYKISSSKIKSDKLFEKIQVPAPKAYPNCEFPVLVKPSDLSGSKGVRIIDNQYELEKLDKDKYVIQEYLEGKSYSIEIVGHNHKYRTFQVTEIIVDEIYDCKRVDAYTELSDEMKEEFAQIAEKIARQLNLEGIMDVEVILNKGKLKVLEIDARFPSQTPITIFNSTKQNILEYLCLEKTYKSKKEKGVVFQHVVLKDNILKCAGEHVMSNQKNLKLVENFFGCNEAITNFEEHSKEWAATLIIVEDTIEEAQRKKDVVIKNIMDSLDIKNYEDLVPNCELVTEIA